MSLYILTGLIIVLSAWLSFKIRKRLGQSKAKIATLLPTPTNQGQALSGQAATDQKSTGQKHTEQESPKAEEVKPKKQKIKFGKIKLNAAFFKQRSKQLRKLPGFVAERAFASIMAVFFVELIVGAVIFYQCSIKTNRAEITSSGEVIQFQEGVYQQTLKAWDSRAKRAQEIDDKKYINPFRP